MANYHILPRSEGWAVKKEKASRANKIFARQDDAIRYASKIATNVYVHDIKGTISRVAKDNRLRPIRRIKSNERVHVIPYNKKWAVKTENKNRPSKVFDSKYNAIRLAHEIADNRGTSMVIHKRNGQINHIDIPPHFQSPIADLIHMR